MFEWAGNERRIASIVSEALGVALKSVFRLDSSRNSRLGLDLRNQNREPYTTETRRSRHRLDRSCEFFCYKADPGC